jgi:aldose 1-epimerase
MRSSRTRTPWVALLVAFGCNPTQRPTMPTISEQPWGRTPDGTDVRLYTLRNAHGLRADITNYGGIVTSLLVPDRAGHMADVVLGYDSLADYLKASPYFGAIVGRYGNRVAAGKFTLEGKTYALAVNDGPNALHGGLKGFDKVVWQAEPYADAAGAGLRLRYVSPDGDEGYPGRLDVSVTYALMNDDALRIDYRLSSDRPTIHNVTHHGYFNLAGHASGDILSHELMLSADRFTPVDSTLIPTGELRDVTGTPFDFRASTAIGARIGAGDEQLRFGRGYDHNFVLNGDAGTLRLVGRVRDPQSGRAMEISTTEPGVQFYSGNFLDGSNVGKGGARYEHRAGFCLETQHFPDSPNHPAFPSTVLRPGEEYRSTTVYRFSAQ